MMDLANSSATWSKFLHWILVDALLSEPPRYSSLAPQSRNTTEDEAFRFHKGRQDIRQLVVVFLSLAFSAMNQTGWDPTIKLSHLDKSGQQQYEIKINDNSYTTVDVLSDSAADSPLGRATRVSKVKDSSDNICR
ncbi:hypothetical protein DFJ43DRAFT_1158660 [Lentinula guzmanii]|uniref:Fungal-type protein kinase domain-containing protein n=1 Tax=Lentinula guzmanii TaxID=2804957 RepID=A0AA38J4V1_9AGAR|nr:hypothetical protein DFJ43DRAFT_1158660 [Lentinula guzmanii]